MAWGIGIILVCFVAALLVLGAATSNRRIR